MLSLTSFPLLTSPWSSLCSSVSLSHDCILSVSKAFSLPGHLYLSSVSTCSFSFFRRRRHSYGQDNNSKMINGNITAPSHLCQDLCLARANATIVLSCDVFSGLSPLAILCLRAFIFTKKAICAPLERSFNELFFSKREPRNRTHYVVSRSCGEMTENHNWPTNIYWNTKNTPSYSCERNPVWEKDALETTKNQACRRKFRRD